MQKSRAFLHSFILYTKQVQVGTESPDKCRLCLPAARGWGRRAGRISAKRRGRAPGSESRLSLPAARGRGSRACIFYFCSGDQTI